jgi:hypothetical protein
LRFKKNSPDIGIKNLHTFDAALWIWEGLCFVQKGNQTQFYALEHRLSNKVTYMIKNGDLRYFPKGRQIKISKKKQWNFLMIFNIGNIPS